MKRLLIGFLGAMSLALPAFAVDEHLPPSVTVVGTGKAFARPDTARINAGVVSEAPTAKEALGKNSDAMAGLVATLKKYIDPKDIQTSGFNVSPEYTYPTPNNGNRPPHITGYRVNNDVSVKVRNLKNLGELLDALVTSGANNINGVSFYVDKPEAMLDQARVDAVKEAHRKAELYSAAAGVKLGRVLYVAESSSERPFPMPMPMMAMSRAAGAPAQVPIETGETEMDASITVIYAIE